MPTQWGRRETVIWPPHSPIHTYGAVTIALMLAAFFLWCQFSFGLTALQRYYTPAYLRSAVGASFQKKDKYRLVYAGDGRKAGRVAKDADVVDGETVSPDGKPIALSLSTGAAAQGLSALYRGPEATYLDLPFHDYLRTAVFEGNTLVAIYRDPLLAAFGCFIFLLPFSISKDVARRKVMKYGRRLKGPVLMSPKEFIKEVAGDGIGFDTSESAEPMRIPQSSEAQHVEIIGDTGSGKTTLIMMMLRQIQTRGESAIIYDPACEFVRRFYDPARGDIILNPLDDRCPYWGPAEELRRKAEAKAIAASLYQPTSDKKGEFFTETPQKIFAHLLTFGPTPQQLIEWMSNPEEIDKRVQGTELAAILTPGAQQQRGGVLASLGLIADSLRMLPTKEQAKTTWTATEWAEKRVGWIFITSKAAEREALRPLHSLWIDLLVLRLLNTPEPDQKKVWFVLDELASLQRLPQLHTAITENRKSKNPLVLGFQGKAQLEVIYGHMAEVMLSQPATKIFLKTTEPKAAEWVSKAIGQVEIERLKEAHSTGYRSGKNFTMDRQTEPLVMDSEISGLADKHAFLKLGNNVARFSFLYTDQPSIAPEFVPRRVDEDELSFDPKTLLPRARPDARANIAAPSCVDKRGALEVTSAPAADGTLPIDQVTAEATLPEEKTAEEQSGEESINEPPLEPCAFSCEPAATGSAEPQATAPDAEAIKGAKADSVEPRPEPTPERRSHMLAKAEGSSMPAATPDGDHPSLPFTAPPPGVIVPSEPVRVIKEF